MTRDIYANESGTALRMPDIKIYLHETVGKLIEAGGFKFNKSAFWFTRRHKKNFEQFFFTFHNYFPLNYNVHFSLRIRNEEIQRVLKAFPYQQNIGNFDFSSIMISMGDFVRENIITAQVKKWTGLLFDPATNRYVINGDADEIKRLTPAQIAGFSYELYNSRDLFETADAMNMLLQKMLPLSSQLSSTGGIYDFFAGRPGWSVKSLRLSNMATELVAAKLKVRQDFHKVYNQLIEAINIRVENMGMSPQYCNIMEALYKWR